jgi:hypothetical protein
MLDVYYSVLFTPEYMYTVNVMNIIKRREHREQYEHRERFESISLFCLNPNY